MTKKTELKKASRRITTRKPDFFGRIWNFIRKIDIFVLANITLLIAIIVAFSFLIVDFCGCKTIQTPTIVRTADKAQNQITVVEKPVDKISLPIRRVTPRPVIRVSHPTMGTTTIAGGISGQKLINGDKIDGNLYLENLRKYTLPCGLYVNGDLFVRNVGILKFCGQFVVTGNIYVTCSSSFGPIPRRAKIGGKIIL